jgi:hypothetical protein
LIPSIVITDLNGRRHVSDQQLPLKIGTEQGADIRLPEWSGVGSFAQISILDDRCFVQPQNNDVKLLLNGVSLVKPKWLDDGDVLSVGGAEIELHDEGECFELEVLLSSEEAETLPPQMASAAGEISYDYGRDFLESDRAQKLADQDEIDRNLPGKEIVEQSVDALAEEFIDEFEVDESIELDEPVTFNQPEKPLTAIDDSGDAHDAGIDEERPAPIVARAEQKYAPLPAIVLPESVTAIDARAPEPETVPGLHKKSRRRILFYWLLLVAVIAYVFMSGKVSIVTAPVDADVSMAKYWAAPGKAGRYLLLPGHYDFIVSAPGYETLSASLDIDFRERQILNFQLIEKPGRLGLDLPTDIQGELFVGDNVVAALSELPVQLPAGTHEFRIVFDRYQEYSGNVTIAGRDVLQTLPVVLQPDWGSFALATDPPGAEIYFDGDMLGTTPATIDLPSGSHELEFRLSGFGPVLQSITSVAGQVEVVPRVLMRASASLLEVRSNPEGAAVSVQNKYQGVTPLSVEIPPNEKVTVWVSKPGYAASNQVVQSNGSESVSMNVELVMQIATVVVEAYPVDAVLFVDGEMFGPATQTLQLSATEHTLEIRREGYQPWVMTISPDAGTTQRLDVSLQADEQVSLDSLPRELRSSLGQELRLARYAPLVAASEADGEWILVAELPVGSP